MFYRDTHTFEAYLDSASNLVSNRRCHLHIMQIGILRFTGPTGGGTTGGFGQHIIRGHALRTGPAGPWYMHCLTPWCRICGICVHGKMASAITIEMPRKIAKIAKIFILMDFFLHSYSHGKFCNWMIPWFEGAYIAKFFKKNSKHIEYILRILSCPNIVAAELFSKAILFALIWSTAEWRKSKEDGFFSIVHSGLWIIMMKGYNINSWALSNGQLIWPIHEKRTRNFSFTQMS